jgi:hypothetical protein
MERFADCIRRWMARDCEAGMSAEQKQFEKWLNAQDMLLIPELGFESIEADLAYLAWQASRADLHAKIMEEWNKPLGEILKDNNGNFVHISDRLRALK